MSGDRHEELPCGGAGENKTPFFRFQHVWQLTKKGPTGLESPCPRHAAARVRARTSKTFRRFASALATCGQSREQRAPTEHSPVHCSEHAPRAGRALWLVPGCGVLGCARRVENGEWVVEEAMGEHHEAAGIGFAAAKGLGFAVSEDREGYRHGQGQGQGRCVEKQSK